MDASHAIPTLDDTDDTLGAALGADAVSQIAAAARRAEPEPPQATGMRALVDSAVVSHERLPMLDVVLDRFVRHLTPSMRNFTSDNIEISIERVTSIRFADFMRDVQQPSLLSILHIPQWENYALITVNSDLTYTIIDALLGGRRNQGTAIRPQRPFTSIETALIGDMINLVVRDLASAFAPVAEVEFKVDRTETNPTFAAIVQPSNICALATIRMRMGGHGGEFDILLPYATIEPIREILLQRFMGEKFGHDGIWEQHLDREIRRTKVDVNAVLGEKRMRLGEVMQFKVGQVIPFSTTERDPIDIRAGGVLLGQGTMGRVGRNVAVKITTTEGPARA